MTITDDDALAMWDDLAADDVAPTVTLKAPYRHYKPLSEAAAAFITEAQSTRRVYTGIDQFDEEMRGIGPGHLGVIAGYSHSGKTQLLLHMLRHNRNKRIAMFIPDEPATLVLTKLTSVTHGIPARELEQRVAADDRDAIRLLVETAEEEFPNLIVFDKTLTAGVLNDGYKEACDVWGDVADMVVVDYVDLIQGVEVVPAKFDILKSFVSNEKVPMWAIHQASRSSGAEGRAMTISSGNYGGEQHATFMIGVRRKKAAIMAELVEQRMKRERNPNSEAAAERVAELEHDLRIHEYTLTANLVKNKRPGGQPVDEIDFELALSTGRIYQMQPGDLPRQYLNKMGAGGTVKPVVESKPWTETEMF